MTLVRSWLASANQPGTEFPLNNLPYGVFSVDGGARRCGVAIGDMILDVTALEHSGIVRPSTNVVFQPAGWNEFMALGPKIWRRFRQDITKVLTEGSDAQASIEPFLLPMAVAELHMPFEVSEYTDFYAGKHHAFNVGSLFRGPENALPPNWLHIPIGYNGRASSVVVSGTNVRRPWGQLKSPNETKPRFAPCERFDLELELGAIVGSASDGPVTLDQANEMIFGYVLLNDWSARDIQAWEYQPLGPFQAKATATTISAWIVTKEALEPFKCMTPEREIELLPYLQDTSPMLYDIDLTVRLAPDGKAASVISQTNYREMYYSSAQQLAHHTTSGCPMRVGDLLGTGTISGPQMGQYGSLLELSAGGKSPITLDTGEQRTFLEDQDTLSLSGQANGDGFTIGFGPCRATILPALEDPFFERAA